MKTLIFILGFIIAASTYTFAQTVAIDHFDVRDNPYAQDEIAIVAVDSLHQVRQNINGTFLFTINGFEDTLKFTSGVAFYNHKLVRSSFIYAKHVNDSGTHSILYYVYRGNDKLSCVHISWVVLLIIPLVVIVLAYMFKRFIIIALIILAIFFYFNYHNGLSMPTFFESIIDGIKHLFH